MCVFNKHILLRKRLALLSFYICLEIFLFKVSLLDTHQVYTFHVLALFVVDDSVCSTWTTKPVPQPKPRAALISTGTEI